MLVCDLPATIDETIAAILYRRAVGIPVVRMRAASAGRKPCLYAECRQAARRGNLCASCEGVVADAVDALIEPYGFEVERVGTRAGYINARVFGLRSAGYRGVHRWVMEWELGRPLLTSESVHHINGDRSDNRPENLELWVTSQPSGQRPEDLAAHARSLLALYGTDDERKIMRGGQA